MEAGEIKTTAIDLMEYNLPIRLSQEDRTDSPQPEDNTNDKQTLLDNQMLPEEDPDAADGTILLIVIISVTIVLLILGFVIRYSIRIRKGIKK